MTDAERTEAMAATRFALVSPADPGPFEFPIPIGVLTGEPAAYQGIVDALADGPRSYAELAELAPFRAAPPARLLKAVTLLVGGRRIHPLSAAGGDDRPAQAFNRALSERLASDEPPRYLAAPLVGTGVAVEPAELAALARGERLKGPRDALLRRLGATAPPVRR
jgi:hypothetical protein